MGQAIDMQQVLAEMKEAADKVAKGSSDPEIKANIDDGYHYEEFAMLNTIGMWDVPGKMRSLWSTFYKALTIHGVFFVVDAKDEEMLHIKDKQRTAEAEQRKAEAEQRIREYKQLLHSLMNEDELRAAVITVIFNVRKDDALAGINAEDHPLYYRYGIDELPKERGWRVKAFIINCDELNGETDPAFSKVQTHLRTVLGDPRSFNLQFG